VGRSFSVFVILLFLCPLLSADSPAPETSLPPEFGAGMPAEKLREILERDMGNVRKTWSIRFKKQRERSSPLGRSYIPEFFQKAGAWILRGFLVLAIAALILIAAIYSYRRRGRLVPLNQSSGQSPPAPSGPPPPPALLEEARRLYRQGSIREAWGCCYAASLGALGLRWGLHFPPGATEYRCLALVRRWARAKAGPAEEYAGPVGAAFAGLIRRWVDFFYGGILPPEGAFEEALSWVGSLCEKPVPAKGLAPGQAVIGQVPAGGPAAGQAANEKPLPGEAAGETDG
jgi:hypothetical protein